MSEQNKDVAPKETGIEVDKVGFDSNGEVTGLDDEALDDVAGGLMDAGCNKSNCDTLNFGC